MRNALQILLMVAGCSNCAAVPAAQGDERREFLSGFRRHAWFGEQVRTEWLEDSVRVQVNAAGKFDLAKPTQLILFATPNGNTIEQSLGSARSEENDARYDLQHIAAQVRLWRKLAPKENVVLATLEAEDLSWPTWRQAGGPESPKRVARIVEHVRKLVPGNAKVTLTCHSGGGSFLFSFIDAHEELPGWVSGFVFLDGNYSYDDTAGHGDRLLRWLKGDKERRLVVLAYDDREITLGGKRVVGPTGGTFRATGRMRAHIEKQYRFSLEERPPFQFESAMGGQIQLVVHPNPDNEILHTVLVGEMNGLLFGLADNGDVPAWSKLGSPRAYTDYIQPAAELPKRPSVAADGSKVINSVVDMSLPEREEVLASEILQGNLPDFLHNWSTVTVTRADADGKTRKVEYQTLPDYLAVGNDDDFVRVPLTPQTTQRLADAFGCALPTALMVDDIAKTAAIRLEPQPLTRDRESVGAFFKHQLLVQSKWPADRPLGELVRGIKKDIVVTNKLSERPRRLAIYGWHRLDGSHIQPLTTVHVDSYVDYSHGIRLIRRKVQIDGRSHDLHRALHDPKLHPLFSDEGPIHAATYNGT